MDNSSPVKGSLVLKKYKHIKDVPRPSPGSAAMFVHILDSGKEVLTCIFDDGRTHQVMDAESTRAQLESLDKKR